MCPVCRTPMLVLELEGVEIDHCPACGGTWLDAGELEEIGGRAGVEPGELTLALRKALGGRRGRRPCPRCSAGMRLIVVGETTPVELDRCPRGHGLWFDRGEIMTLVGSFETGDSGAVARFFAEVYRSEFAVAGGTTMQSEAMNGAFRPREGG